MFTKSQRKILTAADMSVNIRSIVIDLDGINLGSIQSVFTGAPVGSLYIELSNQIIAPSSDPQSAVTQWTLYSGSAYAVTVAGNYIHNLANMGYKWMRLSYDATSGNGALDASMVISDA